MLAENLFWNGAHIREELPSKAHTVNDTVARKAGMLSTRLLNGAIHSETQNLAFHVVLRESNHILYRRPVQKADENAVVRVFSLPASSWSGPTKLGILRFG